MQGNILVRLLLFCLLPFRLLQFRLLLLHIFTSICFYFAALLLNLDLPRFCMPLLKFWVYSFKEHPLTLYDVQIPKSKSLLSWKHFIMGHEVLGVFPQGTSTDIDWNLRQVGLLHSQDVAKREKTKDNSFQTSTRYISTWVRFRKL